LITYVLLLASAPSKRAFTPAGSDWKVRTARKILPYVPDCILTTAGDLAYKHIA
jgi:hypothetical protein